MDQPQRLPYIDFSAITDPAMMAEFERAARDGAPRPESHAIRANVPAVFWAFTNAWNTTFVNGVCDHAIKARPRPPDNIVRMRSKLTHARMQRWLPGRPDSAPMLSLC